MKLIRSITFLLAFALLPGLALAQQTLKTKDGQTVKVLVTTDSGQKIITIGPEGPSEEIPTGATISLAPDAPEGTSISLDVVDTDANDVGDVVLSNTSAVQIGETEIVVDVDPPEVGNDVVDTTTTLPTPPTTTTTTTTTTTQTQETGGDTTGTGTFIEEVVQNTQTTDDDVQTGTTTDSQGQG